MVVHGNNGHIHPYMVGWLMSSHSLGQTSTLYTMFGTLESEEVDPYPLHFLLRGRQVGSDSTGSLSASDKAEI